MKSGKNKYYDLLDSIAKPLKWQGKILLKR